MKNRLFFNNFAIHKRSPKGDLSLTGCKGMTIIETFIALMVLGIVITGVISGLYSSAHIGATTKNRTKMVQKVKWEMEELMAASYADLGNNVEGGDLYVGPYTIAYTLTTTVASEIEGTKEIGKVITLRIDWLQQNHNCYERLETFRRK